MSKSVKRQNNEGVKIHRVGKRKPEKEIDQILRCINNIEDLENIDSDAFLNTTNTKHTETS